MCETTRAIERHPETQRRCLEMRRSFAKMLRDFRRILKAKEKDDALAERHA